jgi:ribosomal protein S11
MINMSKTKRRIGSRRNENRVLKGFIYVQASFNNTIVTVTDVRGQVLCWYSAGACGFKGTRRGTPFAAQTATENVIRTLMDWGMERVEVMISGPGRMRDTTL